MQKIVIYEGILCGGGSHKLLMGPQESEQQS